MSTKEDLGIQEEHSTGEARESYTLIKEDDVRGHLILEKSLTDDSIAIDVFVAGEYGDEGVIVNCCSIDDAERLFETLLSL